MNIVVNYNDPRWKKYNIDFEKIVRVAYAQIQPSARRFWDGIRFVSYGLPESNPEISIVLTNDKEIRKLNKQYRGIDKATNVLSFETGDDVLLGDIYISYDTVARETKEFINHTTHLIVHGVLHLLGYDHIDDVDATKMESMEIAILKKLGVGNPYKDSKVRIEKNIDMGRYKKTILFATISLVCGGISALGFAPFYLWPMTLLGVGVMYFLAHSRHKLFSVLFGFAYAVANFWWVTHSIYVVPELAEQFAIWTLPALIGIGLAGSIVFAIPFLFARRGPFVFAGVWTLVLWLREWFLTGFPWNPIANITIGFPTISNSMSLWGALGLTFVITGLVASVVEIIKFKVQSSKCNYLPLIIFSVLLIIGCVYGHYNVDKSSIIHHPSPIIRIVQPAVSAEQKATHSRDAALQRAEVNVKTLVELASVPGKYDMVVFPETAYPYMIVDNQIPFTDMLDVPVITGAMSYHNGKIFNSMIMARDGYVDDIYSKSHLVPFGEYRPLGDIIPTPGQLTPGNGPEVITVAGFSFVPAICYEIIFSDSLVPYGANPTAIVNITNDTWFGKTPGTYQHLDMVRRYAIESGLPIIRANYSGISAFVGADGRVISSLPVGAPGVLDDQVFGAHMTPYRYIGREGWMIIILLTVIIATVSINGFRMKD